jgi:DNA repair protein RadC
LRRHGWGHFAKGGNPLNYNTALVQLPLIRDSSKEFVRTPEDVYRVCGDIAQLAQESFQVLCLDTKNRLINRQMVSLGIVDAALVHPREVFRPAIADGAAAIVCSHNHPSGDPTPSAEDIRITRQLIDAGKLLDLKLLDHVIIGVARENRSPFVSLREDGLCDFS